MLESYLASAIISDIRSSTDQEDSSQVDDTELLPWIDSEYQSLRRRFAEVAPEMFSALHDFTISGTTTYDLAANVATFSKVLGLFYRANENAYVELAVAEVQNGEYTGGNVDGSYRLRFLTRATKVNATNVSLSLPAGADRIIVERVSARVRVKVDEDPSFHMQEANRVTQDVFREIADTYRATPRSVIDVDNNWWPWFPGSGWGRAYRLRGLVLEIYQA